MNCHSFKKDMTIFGNGLLDGFLNGYFTVTLRLTLKTYHELLELVSRDQ